jgi:CBS domain containing-hemolysin-like protein
MDIFIVILHLAMVVLLLLVMGVRPTRTRMSWYELTRRAREDDTEAQATLRREQLLSDVYSLQRVVTALLLVVISLLGVLAYDWLIGVMISLLIALEAGVLAHTKLLQGQSMKLYEKIEPRVLGFINRFPTFFKLIRSVSPTIEDTTLSSKDELRHLVSESGTLLTDDERQAILSILSFGGRIVKDVMTPRAAIETVKKSEILGPVVMNDLHKKGHSRFPVIDSDLDHIIGILYVQDLLTIEGGKRYTRTVEKAMDKKVFFIKESQTLNQALAAFLNTKHHLFVVVNEYRETVGLLSLEDVVEALIGREVIDEFDVHDDLRAVAERKSEGNNSPKGRVDV